MYNFQQTLLVLKILGKDYLHLLEIHQDRSKKCIKSKTFSAYFTQLEYISRGEMFLHKPGSLRTYTHPAIWYFTEHDKECITIHNKTHILSRVQIATPSNTRIGNSHKRLKGNEMM